MFAPALFRDDLFENLFGDFGPEKEMNRLSRKLYGRRAGREMLMDVREHDGHYEVIIDLPGFRREDIHAELEDGYLTVTAAKGLDEEEKDDHGTVIRQERCAGTLSRTFYVGENLTTEDIHGKYENGVLTLSIPKKDVPELKEDPHRIMIEG